MFERKIRRRNILEYIGGGIGIVANTYIGWSAFIEGEYFMAASWAALVVGVIVIMLNLRRLASNLDHKPEQSCQVHLRAQLEHQRKALDTAGQWYIGPLIPGMLMVFAAMVEVVSRELNLLASIGLLFLPFALVGGFFAGIVWLNKHAAKKLAAEIAELDRTAEPSPA